jgi:endonuclease/exonuclease/phosphatase family metal-dependent hydrolase
MIKEENTLRIVTYNTHKSRGLDGRIRPERIARVLTRLNADIIALQEVWSYEGGMLRKDQARFFSHELNLPHYVGETRKYRGGTYGNVTITRFAVKGMETYDLSVGTRREKRGCLRTDLDLPGFGPLHVFNLHLGTSYFERKHQARKLLDPGVLTNPQLIGKRLVLGDFNEWTLGITTKLLREQFKSIDAATIHPLRSYPGIIPVLPLDHVYFEPEMKLKRLMIYRSPLALLASDHLPLIADFLWEW